MSKESKVRGVRWLERVEEKLKKGIERFVPPDLCCPISRELMQDPVVAEDGHSYEREAITKWFKYHNTSPMTNQELEEQDLIPNIALKRLVEHFTFEA